MTNVERIRERGDRLYAQGWLEAAAESWRVALSESFDPVIQARLHDNIGKVWARRGNAQKALLHFSQAERLLDPESNRELWLLIAMHNGMAMSQTGDVDRAYRAMQSLLEPAHYTSAPRRAMIYANMGAIQMDNELFAQAYDTLYQALGMLEGLPQKDDYGYAIYTNLGVCLIERGEYAKAEAILEQALALRHGIGVHTLTELTRLYVLTGRIDQSVEFGREVMSGIWDSLIAFDKEELAHVSALLGRMAFLGRDRALALRLVERSQSLFGQLGQWRSWRHIQRIVVQLEDRPLPKASVPEEAMVEVRRFADLMELMLAQDLVLSAAWEVADLRNQVAQSIAGRLGWDETRTSQLGYVCRLADYGLTAIDPDVVHAPRRSEASWERYQQHPGLSVRLLSDIRLDASILTAVGDHHEQPNGQGFPRGKKGADISPLALVYAVADQYAGRVLAQGMSHTAALLAIRGQAGNVLQGDLVDHLEQVFYEAAQS